MKTKYVKGHKLEPQHLIIGTYLTFGNIKVAALLETPLKVMKLHGKPYERPSSRIGQSYDVYKVDGKGTNNVPINFIGYSDVEYKVIEVY
jgi:hypothetical protein